MRYYSDDKTVEKALNMSWVLVGIPFFVMMIGVMIAGLFVAGRLKLDFLYPASIALGIAIPAVVGLIASRIWFKYYITRVTDPHQFYKRAINNRMIFSSTADRVVKTNEINLTPIVKTYENLPDKHLTKSILLTVHFIQIKDSTISWADISFISLTYDFKSNVLSDNTTILVHKNDKTAYSYRVRITSKGQADYFIQHYFNNAKQQMQSI